MNIFKLNVAASNPSDQRQMSVPREIVLDTSSELTWLPREMLQGIHVQCRRAQSFPVSGDSSIERQVGLVLLHANGRETAQEVVFAEPGDALRLGLRALDGLGVKLDDVKKGFISMLSLMAFSSDTQMFRRAA